jgi:hypothetical protein
MRKVLSTILRLTGFALGLAAAVLLIALQWPDVLGDLYGANSLRHFVRVFMSGMVLGTLICWPFWWVADKLFPERPVNAVDAPGPGPGRAGTMSRSNPDPGEVGWRPRGTSRNRI